MPIYTLSDLHKAKSKKPAAPAKQKAVAKPRTPIKLPSNIHTISSPVTKESAKKESNMPTTNGRTLSGLVPSEHSRSGRKLSRRTLSASDVAEGMQLDAAAAAAVDPFYDPGRTLADVQTDDDEDLIEEAERDWSGDEMKKKRRRGRKRGKGAKGRKKGAKGKGREQEEKAERTSAEAGTIPMDVEEGASEAETVTVSEK